MLRWLTDQLPSFPPLIEPIRTSIATYYSPIKSFTTKLLSQSLSGFYDAVTSYVSIPRLWSDVRYQPIVSQLTQSNLLFLGGTVSLEVIHHYLRYANVVSAGSTVDYVLDLLSTVIILKNAARLFVPNELNATTQAIIKKLKTQVPGEEKKEVCTCDKFAKINAASLNAFYHYGKLAMVFVISQLPHGVVTAEILKILAYGQAIASYNLESMCKVHRYQVMSKSNPYLFGVGIPITLLLEAAMLAVRYCNNTSYGVFSYSNLLCEYALFSCLLPYFTETFNVNRLDANQNEFDFDFFYQSRLVCDTIIESILTRTAKLNNVNNDVKISERLETLSQSSVSKLIENILLGNELSDIKDIEKIPALDLWLLLNEPVIKDLLIEVEHYRMIPYLNEGISASAWLERVLPDRVIKDCHTLKTILHSDVVDVVNLVKSNLIHYRLNKAASVCDKALLSEQEKNQLQAEIKIRIETMRPKLDKSQLQDLQVINTKIDALHNLIILLKSERNVDVFETIKDWEYQFKSILNNHRNTLSSYFKKTNTAEFVREILVKLVNLQRLKKTNEEITNEMIGSIEEKIIKMQEDIASVQGYDPLKLEKVKILEQLNGLINEYHAKLDLGSIIKIWKEYNWHIANAHRNVTSLVTRNITDAETSTSRFINKLLQPTIHNESQKPPANRIVNLIQTQIDILNLKNKDAFKDRILAFQKLIEMIETIKEPCRFGLVLNKWQRKFIKIINEHRNPINGFINNIVDVKTTTATFIYELDKNYKDTMLEPAVNTMRTSAMCLTHG